jgi:predicted hydrocarbon binding protein/predicted regulator of Ras-like GTPase activity (Roadblock/LC7/MglB family)
MSDLLERTKGHTFKEHTIFKGVIEGTIEGVKQRYGIMEESHWKTFYATMVKFLGDSTNAILKKIGEEYGQKVSKFVKEKYKTNPNITFLYILQNMEKLGWGAFWNIKIEPDSSKIVLELFNSNEAYNAGIASCYHMNGILRGIAQDFWGKDIGIRETKCIAKGDKNCEFLIGKGVSVPDLYNKDIMEKLAKILQDLKATIKSSIEFLATTDGVPILTPNLPKAVDPALLGTIISYTLCGGKQGSQVLSHGNLKEIIINADQGTIIASQCTKNTVLAAVISPDSSPGLAGLALKKAKDKIIELLK